MSSMMKMPRAHPAWLMAYGIDSSDDPIIVFQIEKLCRVNATRVSVGFMQGQGRGDATTTHMVVMLDCLGS